MKFKEINKIHYLTTIIVLFFAVTIGFIVWNKVAIATQRDLKLRIDFKSVNRHSYYTREFSNDISFELKDSIIQEGCSDGRYIIFEQSEEGYDIPVSCSVLPSMFHASAECKSYHISREAHTKLVSHFDGDKLVEEIIEYNINDINHILYNHDVKIVYPQLYAYKHHLQKAINNHATIYAILPSYRGEKQYKYKPIFEDFEIDGKRMSEMIKEMEQHPQEVVDSLMNDILHAIEAYCQSEHCNIGKDYVYILKGCVVSEMRDAFYHYIKLPQGEKAIEEWLVAHKGRIKESYHQYDEVHNAVQQLLTDEKWMEDKENEGIDVLWMRNFLREIAE